MPQRATEFSAGYDLRILNDEVVLPHESRLISFGDSISIENPMVTAVIVPRSSLAKKKGLILSGGPFYVYSGEGYSCITLNFINFTDNAVKLKAGEKIAQAVFIKYPSSIIGGIDAVVNMENADVSVLPDPLDEYFMSPMLENNIEVTPKVKDVYKYISVDQTERQQYYFQAFTDTMLEPGVVSCLMTGLRCRMEGGQVFILKCMVGNQCVELANSVGVIDSDYYDNVDNAGEIGVLLLNRGSVPVYVRKGDVIASGALYMYEKAAGDLYGGKRIGGFGSTDGN